MSLHLSDDGVNETAAPASATETTVDGMADYEVDNTLASDSIVATLGVATATGPSLADGMDVWALFL